MHDVDSAWLGTGVDVQIHDDSADEDALLGVGARGGDAIYVDGVDGPRLEIVSKLLVREFVFGSKQGLQVKRGGPTRLSFLVVRIHLVRLDCNSSHELSLA